MGRHNRRLRATPRCRGTAPQPRSAALLPNSGLALGTSVCFRVGPQQRHSMGLQQHQLHRQTDVKPALNQGRQRSCCRQHQPAERSAVARRARRAALHAAGHAVTAGRHGDDAHAALQCILGPLLLPFHAVECLEEALDYAGRGAWAAGGRRHAGQAEREVEAEPPRPHRHATHDERRRQQGARVAAACAPALRTLREPCTLMPTSCSPAILQISYLQTNRRHGTRRGQSAHATRGGHGWLEARQAAGRQAEPPERGGCGGGGPYMRGLAVMPFPEALG